MENHNPQEPVTSNRQSIILVGALLVIIVLGVMTFLFKSDGGSSNSTGIENQEPQEVVAEPVVEEVVEETVNTVEPEVVEPSITEDNVEPEPAPEEPAFVLPLLSESDAWLKEKLAELTWRKELLKLVIDEDMVRRLVVFTDNFAQGNLAYEYSPLVSPNTKFSVDETMTSEVDGKPVYAWDEAQAKRFSLYVDLLRSFEPEKLAQWYVELKPLIAEAYEEIGYPDDNFTDTLQDAIVRVLDMELPKQDVALVRPSVMFKYADEELESLPASDKLLLRIGKDNLLIIKSFLLEFSDALARAESEN